MTERKPDWADEIAFRLCGFSKQPDAEWPPEWLYTAKPIAAALRKAKADGVRETAAWLLGMVEHDNVPGGNADAALHFEAMQPALRDQADKIEKGEA